jgi:hypothetical protein
MMDGQSSNTSFLLCTFLREYVLPKQSAEDSRHKMSCFSLQKACLFLAMMLSLSSAFVTPAAMTTLASFDDMPKETHNLVGCRPPKTAALYMDIVGISPEPIHTAFALATFGPQPFWLLMILLPNASFTKKIMGSMGTSQFPNLRRFDKSSLSSHPFI